MPPLGDGVEALAAALAGLLLLLSLGLGRLPTGITLKRKVQFCDFFPPNSQSSPADKDPSRASHHCRKEITTALLTGSSWMVVQP